MKGQKSYLMLLAASLMMLGCFSVSVVADVNCPNDMSHYWRFDDAGAPYEDSYGTNDATCTNCPTATSGKVNGAQQFNGSDDEVNVNDDDTFDWGKDDSFTIEYWMKTSESTSGNRVLVGRDDSSTSLHWWIGCDDSGKVAFQLRDVNGVGEYIGGTGPVLNDGNWHLIVAVRDDADGNNIIYVDGNSIDEANHDYTGDFGGIVALNIGYLNLSGHYRYNGIMDEIAIYDRALSIAEIQQHYSDGLAGNGLCQEGPVAPTITSTAVTVANVNEPYSYDVEATGNPEPNYLLITNPVGMDINTITGLIEWMPLAVGDYNVIVEANNVEGFDRQDFVINVAPSPNYPDMTSYWKLDEVASGTYKDSYGDNNGVCAGVCPAPNSNGKINGAQLFDGSTTGIDVPDDDSFDWTKTDSFSIEFWMKKASFVGSGGTNDNEVIIGRDDSGTSLHWWFGIQNSTGAAHFRLGDKTGDSVFIEGPPIDDGKWHHLVAVRDNDAGGNWLYVDGNDVNSISKTYSADFNSSSATLNLGWLNLSPGYHYEGILDEVAIYDRALSEKEILSHYYLARGYGGSCPTPVTIMPLGDSITKGHSSGVPEENKQISYRKDLWDSLVVEGYNVDFVGSLTNGEYYEPNGFDPNHEGHGGWTDTQIASSIYSFLAGNPADVVLLHIGTNSLDSNPNDVNDILDEIDRYDEDITVILARIINRDTYSLLTTQFNDNVEAMALGRIANGDKIIIVDMEDGAGIIYDLQPTGDMYDNIHPYATGYAKMASVWFDALDSFLPVCAPCPPTITSSPVTEATVGKPYTYDVDAIGSPEPNYALTESPGGMTIDFNTGLIEWTPVAVGDVNVTVEATNTEGSDEQSFIITVFEAPNCPADMISYWKMDDTNIPPVVDFYGDNEASSSSGHYPTPAVGTVNGALDFNGVTDYVTVADDNSLDWESTDSFSIELWAKLTNVSSRNKVMIGRDKEGGTHWWLGANQNTGTVNWNMKATDGSGGAVTGTTAINNGQWHHIVAVRDESTDENRLYVDGILEDWATYNYTAGFDADTTLGIGYMAYHLNPDYYYDGLLDEVALYGRALTLLEIQQHYINGLTGYGYCCDEFAPEIISTEVNEAIVDELYSYDVDAAGNPAPIYTLTESPGGMTIDANSGLIEWTPSAIGDVNVVVLATNSDGNDVQAFTIEVNEAPPFSLKINCGGPTVVDGNVTWVSSASYVSGGANYDFDMASVDTTTNSIAEPVPPLAVYNLVRHQSPHTYSIPEVTEGNYVVRIHWTDKFGGDRQIDYDIEGVRVEDDWDIVAEAGGTAIAIDKEYIVTVSDGNGMQIVSSADSGDAFESAIEITTLTLAPAAPNIISTPVTDAYKDELYSYDVDATGNPAPIYTLTESPGGMIIDANSGLIEWTPSAIGDVNVTVEANNTEGLDQQDFVITVSEAPLCPLDMTHYWKLDDSGAPYEDSYGTNDATCTNCPTATSGKVNGAQQFNGSDDEVNVNDDDTFDWGKDDSFTIEYWMKTSESTSGNRVIVGRDPPSGSSLHWWIGCDDNGTVRFQLTDINGNGKYIGGTGPVLNDGNWHLIVAVRDDADGNNIIYVDANNIAEAYHDYTAGFGADGVALNIGYLNLGGHYRYAGVLDEVAIYDRALSIADIQKHYNDGLAGKGYCNEEPVAPTITSTPDTNATVGKLYTYDVDANGNPPSTYALVESPNDMTIDANNGLIEWEPNAVGDVNVIVEANNIEGFDQQAFTINVAPASVCPNDMISYWKMDDTDIPPIVDCYGDNDGTCSSGCPDHNSSGIVNEALYFDGSDSVDVSDNDTFDWGATDSFSIEYWMKASGSSGNRVLIGRDDGSLHWWVGTNSSGQAACNLKDGATSVSMTGSINICNNSWHHIVMLKDESTNYNRIYVDGVEDANVYHDYSNGFASSTELNIAHLNGGYQYTGYLDEMAIYNRVLTTAEILDHYNSGSGKEYCCTDSDGDGTCDATDNCPDTYNPDQNDVDADGFGDICDNCSDTYNPDQNDVDGDGVGDKCDNCPDTYNPNQVDTDGDGIGDICECDAANIDGLGYVNFKDFAIVGADWMDVGPSLPGDTNRSGVVDANDLAQVAQWWLNECNH